MYQILIGKSTNNGPISSFYQKTLDVGSINFPELTSEIVEGLRSASSILMDTSIIDALSSTEMNSAMDLRCLQYHLSKQNVSLMVTRVGSDVIDGTVDILIKMTTPFNDQFGIAKAIDYPFVGKVDMVEVIDSLISTYPLFTPELFLESPINEVMTQIKDAQKANIPTEDLVNQALNILSELGFSMSATFING